MINIDSIELEIMDLLRNYLIKINDFHKPDSFWTRDLKEILGKLGFKNGFKVCSSGFPDFFENEWLYDMIWYEETQNKFLKHIHLAVEIEWGRDLASIKYDFEKLLVTNAKRKLFICQAKPYQIKEFTEYFEKAINNYEECRKGDRFLVAMLDDYNNGEFIFNNYLRQ